MRADHFCLEPIPNFVCSQARNRVECRRNATPLRGVADYEPFVVRHETEWSAVGTPLRCAAWLTTSIFGIGS